MMIQFGWVPHIYSELLELWPDLDVERSLYCRNRNIVLHNLLDDDGFVKVTCLEVGLKGCMTFAVDYNHSTSVVSVKMMGSGLCRITSDDLERFDTITANTLFYAVFTAVTSFIGDDIIRSSGDDCYDTIGLSNSFGPVTAIDEHDAVIRIFKSLAKNMRDSMYHIMDSDEDQLILFDMVGLLTRQLSYAKSFVSSVKSIVPDEYEGMMNTLDRYRQFIDDRFRTITVDGDVRREMGQRELNRSALSINRGMYYLSVLGIAVGMFGASIVADCIGFLGTTSKAIIISATSAIVLAVCWRICSRRSDDMEDVTSPSLERSS